MINQIIKIEIVFIKQTRYGVCFVPAIIFSLPAHVWIPINIAI